MAKHWTHFLHEAGSIKRKGDDILFLTSRRDALIRELSTIDLVIEEMEDETFNLARTDWTIEEITEAKEKAKETK